MRDRKTPENNSFGTCLEQQLLRANVKNFTLANALSYDVSYISKWITGRAVPSRKNIEKIISVAGSLIAERSEEKVREEMRREHGVQSDRELRAVVENALRDAYYATVGELDQRQYVNNAALRVAPKGPFSMLEEYALSLNEAKTLSIAVMADLFALDRSSKLRMAGIEEHAFRLKVRREGISMDYIVDLSRLDGGSVYDVILLIHMMTCFSLVNFRLYNSSWARDKLLIAVRDEFAGVTMLTRRRQFLCTTSTREKKTVEELYESVEGHIDPDELVFSPTAMRSILLNHEYFHNLISRNRRWLVGHITEHFISRELFYQLLEQRFPEDVQARQEAERAYLLAGNMLRKKQVKAMIYDRALVDFVLSGELDFFNEKVILPPEQRREELRHIKEILSELDAESLKLIKEGFSEDFKYITNPCLFLSDSVSYLRLENKQYRDNLLLVRSESMKKTFDVFFEKIWNDDQEQIISEHNVIMRKLEDLIETATLLS